jgi:hypothetical protein
MFISHKTEISIPRHQYREYETSSIGQWLLEVVEVVEAVEADGCLEVEVEVEVAEVGADTKMTIQRGAMRMLIMTQDYLDP